MEPVVLTPEKGLKTLWLFLWLLWFVIGTMLWLALMFAQPIVFGLILFVWLAVMIPLLIWMPAYYASLHYVIDADSIKGKMGVFWRRNVTVPFIKITNLDITQGPLQRAFDIGTIHVQTAGASSQQGAKAELSLLGVRNLEQVKEDIMQRIRAHTVSAAELPKTAVSRAADTDVLSRMLDELVAIRKTLENRNN